MSKTKEILESEGYLNNEDAEIILYGINQLKVLLGGIFFVIFISFILDIPRQGLLFVILFVPLRMYSGGYHANTQFKCLIISCITVILGLIFIKYLEWNGLYDILIQLFNYFILLILSPVENNIHKLTKNEKNRFKKRSCLIGLLILLLYFISFFLKKIWVLSTIQTTSTIISGSLIAGYIKYNLLLTTKYK